MTSCETFLIMAFDRVLLGTIYLCCEDMSNKYYLLTYLLIYLCCEENLEYAVG